jgi:predicted MPP superfamily phosphohydrolase
MRKTIIYILAALTATTATYGQKNTPLHFNSEGKFKIVQFTDIHYKPTPENPYNPDIDEIIARVLDAERPDLVVYTGDIVTGAPDQKGWDIVLKAVIDRKIPYAVTLGNHDDEYGDWNREQIAAYLEKQPYSLFKRGDKNIKGVGNSVLKINSRDNKTAAILYIMDSNAYHEIDGKKWWDWFSFSQVDWYRKTSRELTRKNNGQPYPALAFFHIPLHEYIAMFDSTKTYYKRTDATITGDRKEPECPGILNTGMFAAMSEAGDVMGTFVGHDHSNNYIGTYSDIALAYGCNTGMWGGLNSGGRVIELHENQRSFDTWIRRANGSVQYRVNYPKAFNDK